MHNKEEIKARVFGVLDKKPGTVLRREHWGFVSMDGNCTVCAVGALILDEALANGRQVKTTDFLEKALEMMDDPFMLGFSDGFEGQSGKSPAKGKLRLKELTFGHRYTEETSFATQSRNRNQRHEIHGEEYIQGYELGAEIYEQSERLQASA